MVADKIAESMAPDAVDAVRCYLNGHLLRIAWVHASAIASSSIALAIFGLSRSDSNLS